MAITVTSTEAKNNFGELLKWTKENAGAIYVKQYGEPTAVILSLTEFEKLQADAAKEQKRRVLAKVENMRRESWASLPEDAEEVDAVKAYMEAGFTEDVAVETANFDRHLVQSKR